MLESYSKQDNVAPTPHNIILFELDLNVKFPLLCLLQFLSDLKRTMLSHLSKGFDVKKIFCEKYFYSYSWKNVWNSLYFLE